MLVDWIVAICLLFIMHYIMAFSNLLVKKVFICYNKVEDEEVIQ